MSQLWEKLVPETNMFKRVLDSEKVKRQKLFGEDIMVT